MSKNNNNLSIISITVAIIAVAIDYVAKSANSSFVLHNDLTYLPSLLAGVTIGWLYRKNLKAAAVGVVGSVVSATLLYLLVGKLIETFAPYNSIWSAVGPQLAYLAIPVVAAILFGGYAASKAAQR